jgi:iron(III) transport system substrate-binding protein
VPSAIRLLPLCIVLVAAALGVAACGGDDDKLTVYSGRSEELVGDLFEQFEKESGIKLEVRYGDSAELAATLIEEGDNTPADVFFSQDAGSLGAVEKAGLFQQLDEEIVARVPARFRSPDGYWVGTSGRARVIAYDKRELSEKDLPKSVLDLTDPKWKGRVGWAPTNASFQAFVTALRLLDGDQAAEKWLKDMRANDVQRYENNIAIRDAIANGEIDAGLINHYYVLEAIDEQGPDYPVGLYFPPNGDIGALVNVAGAGILKASDKPQQAEQLIRFLLSREGQQYFAEETKEYPLTAGVKPDPTLPPLNSIQQPDVDLTQLDDLRGTLDLIEQAGIL